MIKINKNNINNLIIILSLLFGLTLSSYAHEPLRGIDLSRPIEIDGDYIKQGTRIFTWGDFGNLEKEPESKDSAQNAEVYHKLSCITFLPSVGYTAYGLAKWQAGGSSVHAILGSALLGFSILMEIQAQSEMKHAVELHNKRFEKKSHIDPFVDIADSAGIVGLSFRF